MIYVKVNETLYPAQISGKMKDHEWNGRESKAITLTGDYTTVNTLFSEGVVWSIVSREQVPVTDEAGEPVFDSEGNPVYTTQQTEFDNSEFTIRGDLTVHADGTCTVVMGKETEIEILLNAMYGGAN